MMKITQIIKTKTFFVLIFVLSCISASYSQTLSGKVVDEDNNGIENALVELANITLSTTTDNEGTWSITVPSSIEPFIKKHLRPVPVLKSNIIYFAVNSPNQQIKADIYTLNGSFIYNVINKKVKSGFYSLNPLKRTLNPNIYVVKFQIGNKTTCFRLLVTNRPELSEITLQNKKDSEITGMLRKQTVVIDTVKASKDGYSPASVPVSSYNEGPLTITLKKHIPSYYLNPPDPCYNQFHVDGCIQGDPGSACGGNCIVANSCSPPEDGSKANLVKTFICPRFMLFSTEMIQAAKDDARSYGWDENDPPFNYGVVGHDPDIGGIDDGPSSCCQCYQIIYEKPEPSSPQPPDLPYPKPLIVQSFNTAASGPYGFDVFMGAGGYGAFNSCYDDPDFSNTSNFDEFIYDEYPYQNPNSGGISFLRYPELCMDGWPPTIEGIQSAACQEKIRELCNQALVNSSEQITEDTRRSCIQSNQIESLYHQNWDVIVKRVRCPDNLTRVTGCRLIEDDLPLPSPEVQTPADAIADGSFLSGYHTTTMQDCCKPTCAWSDWTENYGLPVDGEWNSFYSCDKNGLPFTK